MSDGTAVPDAMSPEARIARALNLLAAGLPCVGLFGLAAEGFRRHARWRWLAQLAALSPLWLSAIAELLQALGRLR